MSKFKKIEQYDVNDIVSGDVSPIQSSRNFKLHDTVMADVNHNAQKIIRNASRTLFHGRDSKDFGNDFESNLCDHEQRRKEFHDDDELETRSHSSIPILEDARLYADFFLSAKSKPKSSSIERQRYCVLVWSVIGIVVIAIMISLFVSRGMNPGPDSGNSSIGNSANSSTPVKDDSSKPSLPPRLIATTQFLSQLKISTKLNLDDISMPQFQAAFWISELDELAFTIPDSRSHPNYLPFVQRYVLALLYFSTGGHKWKEQNSFLGKQDVCNWFTDLTFKKDENLTLGVTCNNLGKVKQLLMQRNNLNGNLPSELAYLDTLDFVDFNRNNIEGTIPNEYSSLSRMTFFDVRNNQLQGTFPEWIGTKWVELKELAFANNQMNGTLPTSLENLSNLRTLSLAHNAFESSMLPINALRNLEYLFLQENKFTGTVDNTFLNELKKLIQVDISSNKLNSLHIPSHLFEYPFLKVLHLGSNKLMGSLPDLRNENLLLEYLSLSNNTLNGTLPKTLSQLHGLKHLDITANHLSGDIPVTLSTMKTLSFLFLSENAFNPGPVPDFLSSIPHLRELSLSLTHRTGTLPGQWLESLPNLVLLDVSYNDMEGTLPSTLWEHPRLQFLLLNRNRFSDTLPDGISDTQLQLLSLDKNNLEGDFSEVCEKKVPYVFTDCGKVICHCCTCCEDDNPKCNNDLLYSNQDFSWENGYSRNFYAFSPLILIDPSIDP